MYPCCDLKMLSLSALVRDFNAFSAYCLEGQRRSGEEKNRRRTVTSTATRPTVKLGGAAIPANATACFLCPTTKPTQHTDVCPTCISAEPSELQLQHFSNSPTHRHGTGGPLCPPLNWASFSSGSKCGHHPARVGGG